MSCNTITQPASMNLSQRKICGFLDLPGELRNMIYTFLSSLYQLPQEASGLALSCRQIYTEFEGLAVKVTLKRLRKISGSAQIQRIKDKPDETFDCQDIFSVGMDFGKTFYSLNNLIIRLNIKRHLNKKLQSYAFVYGPLYEMLGLHLPKLTISFYEESPRAQLLLGELEGDEYLQDDPFFAQQYLVDSQGGRFPCLIRKSMRNFAWLLVLCIQTFGNINVNGLEISWSACFVNSEDPEVQKVTTKRICVNRYIMPKAR